VCLAENLPENEKRNNTKTQKETDKNLSEIPHGEKESQRDSRGAGPAAGDVMEAQAAAWTNNRNRFRTADPIESFPSISSTPFDCLAGAPFAGCHFHRFNIS